MGAAKGPGANWQQLTRALVTECGIPYSEIQELTPIQIQALLAKESDPPELLSPATLDRLEQELRQIHGVPE